MRKAEKSRIEYLYINKIHDNHYLVRDNDGEEDNRDFRFLQFLNCHGKAPANPQPPQASHSRLLKKIPGTNQYLLDVMLL